MDLLNIVFNVLNLLATVIFRSRPKAKHYFKNKKD